MKKKLGLVGIVASAALVGSSMLVPSANAAQRTLIVWADDQRGPQLTTSHHLSKLLAPAETIAPHSADGGRAPRPKKERPERSNIPLPASRAASTKTGPEILGRRSTKRARVVEAPSKRLEVT